MNNEAVFAGTFDPFTLGHYEIVLRASKIFDKIIVAVAGNFGGKKCRYDAVARAEIARKSLNDISNVEVVIFDGMLTDFMRERGVKTFVRGLRNSTDFEYEKTLYNAYLSQYAQIEGLYLMSSSEYAYLSSSLVREVLSFGGNIEKYVKAEALSLIK